MYIDDFIWLPDIVEKLIVKHGVTQDEAEEVFFDRPRYRFVEAGHSQVKMCTPLSGRRKPVAI